MPDPFASFQRYGSIIIREFAHETAGLRKDPTAPILNDPISVSPRQTLFHCIADDSFASEFIQPSAACSDPQVSFAIVEKGLYVADAKTVCSRKEILFTVINSDHSACADPETTFGRSSQCKNRDKR